MDKALIKVGREDPHLVTAVEIKRQYGTWLPKGIAFTCPRCGQPVTPCAMSPGSLQSPHFRHVEDNEKAQQCELYREGLGEYTGLNEPNVPLPMFIRLSDNSLHQFVVEGGFYHLDKDVLLQLQREHTKIQTGNRLYDVNSRRFGAGLARIPFESISLKPSRDVRLINSSLRLESIRGLPEDADRAMVFVCNSAFQGRRLRSGESVEMGSKLLLLAPLEEEKAIGRAFSHSRKIGFAGSLVGQSKLQVFYVVLSLAKNPLEREATYLKSCHLRIANTVTSPEFLWPPSLVEDGAVRPLSSKSCIFGIRATPGGTAACSELTGGLPDHIRTFSLKPSKSAGYGYLVLPPSGNLVRLVMADSRSPEGASLLDSNCRVSMYPETNAQNNISVTMDEGKLCIKANVPALVLWLRHGHPWEQFELKEGTPFERPIKSSDYVLAVRKLDHSAGYLRLWEHLPLQPSQSSVDEALPPVNELEKRASLLERYFPEDKRLAAERKAMHFHMHTITSGKDFAQRRSLL